jgi:uncharacterized membrane protein YhaH (DUF805 family)
MSRLPFLACGAALLAVTWVYGRTLAPSLDGHVRWIVYTLLLFPTACILSKRLHDRGRAGWWGFLIVWALVEAWSRPVNMFGYVALLVLAATFVDLGLLPGEPKANRFGPGPAG